jgi:hypothetical protein
MSALRVFRPVGDTDKYASLTPTPDSDWDVIKQIDGRLLSASWKPLRLRWIKELEDGTKVGPTDFPWLARHVPVISERAVRALRDLLTEAGELLEVDCEGERLWALNVRRFVDVLDVGSSKIEYFADGRVMRVHRYVFKPSEVKGVTMFKVPQQPLGPVFVTQPFVSAVESAGLTGFSWKLVWESS